MLVRNVIADVSHRKVTTFPTWTDGLPITKVLILKIQTEVIRCIMYATEIMCEIYKIKV